MAAAASVGDGVVPFEASDDSDPDEGNQGRTMATEYELAPLEGNDGSTGAEFGRDGQAGATAENEVPPLEGTDEADAEADAGGEEPGARAGDAVEANGGAVQRVEVDVQAQAWLADVEHDRETRADMIEHMLAGGHLYSPEEDSKIQALLAMLATDSSHTQRARRLKHGATVESSWTRLGEDGVLVGKTELVIHGASPLDIIAFLMDADSNFIRSRFDPNVDVHYGVREVRNAHYSVTFNEVKTAPFRNRIFLQAVVWKKLSDATYVWCTYPIANHSTVQPSEERHAVRAELVRSRLG